MKNSNKADKPVSPPYEFSQLVCNLLVSCIQGIYKTLPVDDSLGKKLAALEAVVRKGVRITPATGLAKEIEEYFDRLVIKQKFMDDEKIIVKSMVLEVVETIRAMLSSSSGFQDNIGKCAQNIENANNIEDILQLKDIFIGEIHKIKEHSLSLKDELEEHRKNSTVLAKKLEQSQAQALVDPLTNVLNRAAYNLKIGQMIHEFKRYKDVWALLVLDIDNFKNFNDKYGHHTGDKVLKSVAGTVRDTIRISDHLFRYGGEEFVVFLSRVDAKIATQLAEKICRRVESDYFVDGANKLKVTISIGGSLITQEDTELSLFERADRAMYGAKANGRNQVMIDL